MGASLRWKAGAKPVRRWRDVHKLMGLTALFPLILLSGTGVMLALPDLSLAGLGSAGLPMTQRPVPVFGPIVSGHPTISVSSALQRARVTYRLGGRAEQCPRGLSLARAGAGGSKPALPPQHGLD